MFDMKKRWNRIVANPEIALASTPNEETDGKAFRSEAMAFARSLQERYKYHQVRNELGNVKALASGYHHHHSGQCFLWLLGSEKAGTSGFCHLYGQRHNGSLHCSDRC